MILDILKTLLCRHHYTFHKNIYGDEIQVCGYKRSMWKCNKCGSIKLGNYLN